VCRTYDEQAISCSPIERAVQVSRLQSRRRQARRRLCIGAVALLAVLVLIVAPLLLVRLTGFVPVPHLSSGLASQLHALLQSWVHALGL
jgi:ABC-type Fe3+ transport system permease subunit